MSTTHTVEAAGASPAIAATTKAGHMAGFFLSEPFRRWLWWADHETPYPAAQMDAIFQQLTLPGAPAGLGRAEEQH